ETDEDGNVDVKKPLNATVFQWGFSFQYNLQYLQSYVRDVGLPTPINRMIPIVELVLETPIDGRNAGHTTGTVNPGIIWFGKYFQLGIEAVIPVNHDVSKNVGALAQIHFYLDDIWPQVFTWTPFHGVLGPTQPQLADCWRWWRFSWRRPGLRPTRFPTTRSRAWGTRWRR